MVDLHCHILPSMDDGAKNTDETVKLIKSEKENGVNTVVLTPHFNFERNNIENFIHSREHAFDELRSAVEPLGLNINFVLGCEVFFSPRILEEESIRNLCISGTDYMLVEFPFDYFPKWIPDVLYQLKLNGVTPIIAHVERYPHFEKYPNDLYEFVNSGYIAQANASEIATDKHGKRKKIFSYIKHNLVHIIATDAHSLNHRPPQLGSAMKMIGREFGKDTVDYFIKNSEDIIDNNEIDSNEPLKLKKKLSLFK